MEGLIHLYCGDSKGKTTAAMGLALRACNYNKRIMVVQFLKDGTSGEIKMLSQQPNVTVVAGMVADCFFSSMSDEQKSATLSLHNEHLAKARAFDGDILILDEVCAACKNESIDIEQVRQLLDNKPSHQEIIMTGRNPQDFMLEKADYITEMVLRRHPYQQGICARESIEY